jgi:hypothetical protein
MIRAVAILLLTLTATARAQTSGDELLSQALQNSTLTDHGKPFHAILNISPGPTTDRKPSPGPAYSGRVEVWWSNSTNYRLAITSPDFTLHRTVANDKVAETSTGTFYPDWLETFVRALIDPVPSLFTSAAGAHFEPARTMGGFSTQARISRDDKTNGITNDLTWGNLGLITQNATPVMDYVVTLPYDIFLSHRESFQGKLIARTYQTFVLDNQEVIGQLSTLEPLSPADAATFTVTEPTPPAQLIHTQLVSTLKEESLLEQAPTIQWPPVHEGKTDGYMIVYARTDRTGQVREAHTHNSDNAELEVFGMQQAFHYKFRPLLVDGVSEQMEMPLVLHFTSQIKDPPLLLTTDQMKHQVRSCNLPPIPSGVLAKDQHAILRLSIHEDGTVGTMRPNSTAPWGKFMSSALGVMRCTFKPYVVDGKPITYNGDYELPAR